MTRDTNGAGYTICCPCCGKVYRFDDRYVDEIVGCGCGLEFYAFAMGHLHIAIPASEARYEPIARVL